MATPALNISGINSEWLARDRNRYIVRIPTPGGSGNFNFKDYGGSSEKALKAAKVFQKKMLRQLQFDRTYYKEHGEVIEREHLHVNNKTGMCGVHRMVCPNGFQSPRIEWIASWTNAAGKRCVKGFSTADKNIKNEQDAKQKAAAYRLEKHSKKFK